MAGLLARSYVAAGWMKARLLKREGKSESGKKSVNGCWYDFLWLEEEDILATSWRMSWRRWKQWLYRLTSLAVGWCCVWANGAFSGRDLIGKLCNSLWIILPKQLHSDLAFFQRTDANIIFYLGKNTWK